jgi:hypothetical protein
MIICYFDVKPLKQHACRLMLIVMNILKIFLKIEYCEVIEESNLHTAKLVMHTIYINNHKEAKICKKIASSVKVEH